MKLIANILESALDKYTLVSGRSCSDGWLKYNNLLDNFAAKAQAQQE